LKFSFLLFLRKSQLLAHCNRFHLKFTPLSSVDIVLYPVPRDRQLVMATTSEREHTGDLIIEAVNAGASLMLSITKFLTYRRALDNSLLILYATISITTTLLYELGTTINEYETIFPIKNDFVKPAVKMCKENVERLFVVVKEGTAKGICKSNILGVRFMDASSLSMFLSSWNTLIPIFCLRGTLTSTFLGKQEEMMGLWAE
jgi:hypothetical protein